MCAYIIAAIVCRIFPQRRESAECKMQMSNLYMRSFANCHTQIRINKANEINVRHKERETCLEFPEAGDRYRARILKIH